MVDMRIVIMRIVHMHNHIYARGAVMPMVMLSMESNIVLPKNMICITGNMKGGMGRERCHRECGLAAVVSVNRM